MHDQHIAYTMRQVVRIARRLLNRTSIKGFAPAIYVIPWSDRNAQHLTRYRCTSLFGVLRLSWRTHFFTFNKKLRKAIIIPTGEMRHLIATTKEEACILFETASLCEDGRDRSNPVYVLPWGTHSQECLNEFCCTNVEQVRDLWDRWMTGCHPHFRKVHIIRAQGTQPELRTIRLPEINPVTMNPR